MLTVHPDPGHNAVVIKGQRFEVRLGWAQAAALATLLNQASQQAEPPAPLGRLYVTQVER